MGSRPSNTFAILTKSTTISCKQMRHWACLLVAPPRGCAFFVGLFCFGAFRRMYRLARSKALASSPLRCGLLAFGRFKRYIYSLGVRCSVIWFLEWRSSMQTGSVLLLRTILPFSADSKKTCFKSHSKTTQCVLFSPCCVAFQICSLGLQMVRTRFFGRSFHQHLCVWTSLFVFVEF